MTQVAFYQVQENTPAAVDAVLPALLLKATEAMPVLLVAPTAARAQRLDEGLWGTLGSLGPTSFLPHGTPLQGTAAAQPILIVNPEETPEAAPHLTATQGARLPIVLAGAERVLDELLPLQPTKICYLFSTLPTEVERARTLYKSYKNAGHDLQYFQQEGGRWVRK